MFADVIVHFYTSNHQMKPDTCIFKHNKYTSYLLFSQCRYGWINCMSVCLAGAVTLLQPPAVFKA